MDFFFRFSLFSVTAILFFRVCCFSIHTQLCIVTLYYSHSSFIFYIGLASFKNMISNQISIVEWFSLDSSLSRILWNCPFISYIFENWTFIFFFFRHHHRWVWFVFGLIWFKCEFLFLFRNESYISEESERK